MARAITREGVTVQGPFAHGAIDRIATADQHELFEGAGRVTRAVIRRILALRITIVTLFSSLHDAVATRIHPTAHHVALTGDAQFIKTR